MARYKYENGKKYVYVESFLRKKPLNKKRQRVVGYWRELPDD